LKLPSPGLQSGGRDQEDSGTRKQARSRKWGHLRRLRGRRGAVLEEGAGKVSDRDGDRRKAPRLAV